MEAIGTFAGVKGCGAPRDDWPPVGWAAVLKMMMSSVRKTRPCFGSPPQLNPAGSSVPQRMGWRIPAASLSIASPASRAPVPILPLQPVSTTVYVASATGEVTRLASQRVPQSTAALGSTRLHKASQNTRRFRRSHPPEAAGQARRVWCNAESI
jgi:hypothetical protein